MVKKIVSIMIVCAFLLGSVSTMYAAEPKEKAKAAEPAKVAKVDINSATEADLTKIPGIGEKIAKAIVEYRAKEPFKTIEDIKKVKGISDKKFAKIKDQIEVKEVKK